MLKIVKTNLLVLIKAFQNQILLTLGIVNNQTQLWNCRDF